MVHMKMRCGTQLNENTVLNAEDLGIHYEILLKIKKRVRIFYEVL